MKKIAHVLKYVFDAKEVVVLFLNFGQKWASCSYEIVFIKKFV